MIPSISIYWVDHFSMWPVSVAGNHTGRAVPSRHLHIMALEAVSGHKMSFFFHFTTSHSVKNSQLGSTSASSAVHPVLRLPRVLITWNLFPSQPTTLFRYTKLFSQIQAFSLLSLFYFNKHPAKTSNLWLVSLICYVYIKIQASILCIYTICHY